MRLVRMFLPRKTNLLSYPWEKPTDICCVFHRRRKKSQKIENYECIKSNVQTR